MKRNDLTRKERQALEIVRQLKTRKKKEDHRKLEELYKNPEFSKYINSSDKLTIIKRNGEEYNPA